MFKRSVENYEDAEESPKKIFQGRGSITVDLRVRYELFTYCYSEKLSETISTNNVHVQTFYIACSAAYSIILVI